MTKTEMISNAITTFEDARVRFLHGDATAEELNAAADAADALLLEASDEPDLIGREEAEDFERTAEDMELRARRLEAEREADMEAYWDSVEQQEAAEKDGGDR